MRYDKFSELGIDLSGKPAKAPEREIELVEALVGEPLPKSYREMLLTFKTAVFFDKEIGYKPLEPSPWASDDGIQDIVLFYGPKGGKFGLAKAIKTFRDRLPNVVIPVAGASGGNQICLGVKGEVREKVFFWDHEGGEGDKQGHKNLYLIAESFDSFVELLEVIPDKKLDVSGVKLWLDESLRPPR